MCVCAHVCMFILPGRIRPDFTELVSSVLHCEEQGQMTGKSNSKGPVVGSEGHRWGQQAAQCDCGSSDPQGLRGRCSENGGPGLSTLHATQLHSFILFHIC